MRKIVTQRIWKALMATWLLCLMHFTGIAQGQYNTVNWKFSNPKQFGFTVMDMNFADNNNVIAVGSDGGIAKSKDAGVTWTYGAFTFPMGPAGTNPGTMTKSSFADVHYITPAVAYAVGTNGCMAKTIDGGTTWNLVITPLYARARNINAVWFLNKDTGYIGGQHNTPDSLPKLYFTRNGGATWDSLNAPLGGKTRVGYINNANLPPLDWDVTAKDKEIHRIQFTSPTNGYIIGSGTGLFPRFPSATAGTCLPTGTTTTTGSQNAALVWKFSNGTLTDYSLSKERLGYTGINTSTITCTTTYGNITPQTQTYKALHIISDSAILIISFNNNIVVRINTGRNDSTQNANIPGLYERGRYQLLNFPSPPNGGTPIPATQVLLATNPLVIKKAPNGKLFTNTGSGTISPWHRIYTSIDTGRTWVTERAVPTGRNYSEYSISAMDIAPNGKFLAAGQNGIVTDSVPGAWNSTYITVPTAAGYNKIEFADCANGAAAGGANITVTTDGGNSWIDKGRPDFAASNYNINGLAYPNVNTGYVGVSSGIIYKTTDKFTTLDPVYLDANLQIQDVAAIGNDTVWAVASSAFTVAAANRTSTVLRSTNGGATWTTHGSFAVGTTFQTLTDIEFPSRQIGYIAGNKDTLWKSIDGGVTWNKLPLPTPGVTPQITYTDLFALDNNTIFVTGNGFPRKVVYKSTDGGNTWTDITTNIPTIYPVGNMNGVLFHDANNGYVVGPGGALMITNNGGASWTLDLAPTGSLFSAMSFDPKTVVAGTPMSNRKLFVVGPNLSGAPIMQYGTDANLIPNSTEAITAANCSNRNGGAVTLSTTGGVAPYTYSLNGGVFQSSNTFTGLAAGTYTIRIKGSACDSSSKTITIPFNDNLTIRASNDTTVCANAPVPLNVTSFTGATFSWTPTAGLTTATIANPTAIVSTNTSYVVTASLNGCTRKDTVNISIMANPPVSAGPDRTILPGDIIQLAGSSSNTLSSIVWTPTTGVVSGGNTLSPFVNPNTTTTYTLTVKDVNGCTSSDDAVVNVLTNCIDVRNAFTPNGDGIHDKWVISNNAACFTGASAAVYNRYGALVYKSDNYQNNWDGTYKGKPVPDGTYYYVVSFKMINGSVITQKGDVTILR